MTAQTSVGSSNIRSLCRVDEMHIAYGFVQQVTKLLSCVFDNYVNFLMILRNILVPYSGYMSTNLQCQFFIALCTLHIINKRTPSQYVYYFKTFHKPHSSF